MAQEFQTARSAFGRPGGRDRRWLVALVSAMEQAARPEVRSVSCDLGLISAAKAHLACATPTFAHHGSAYSLRN